MKFLIFLKSLKSYYAIMATLFIFLLVARSYFFLNHWQEFNAIPYSQILSAALWGFRFDISAVIYIVSPILILYLINYLVSLPLFIKSKLIIASAIIMSMLSFVCFLLLVFQDWFFNLYWTTVRLALPTFNQNNLASFFILADKTKILTWIFIAIIFSIFMFFWSHKLLRFSHTHGILSIQHQDPTPLKIINVLLTVLVFGVIARGSLSPLPLGHYPVTEFSEPILNYFASQLVFDFYNIIKSLF